MKTPKYFYLGTQRRPLKQGLTFYKKEVKTPLTFDCIVDNRFYFWRNKQHSHDFLHNHSDYTFTKPQDDLDKSMLNVLKRLSSLETNVSKLIKRLGTSK